MKHRNLGGKEKQIIGYSCFRSMIVSSFQIIVVVLCLPTIAAASAGQNTTGKFASQLESLRIQYGDENGREGKSKETLTPKSF